MSLAILLIPLFILLIAFGIYYSYLQQQKRRDELAGLGRELGWRYDADEDYDFSSRYADFHIFQRGHSQYAYNTLDGAIEIGGAAWPARMGDFHYEETSSNGKQTTTHNYEFSYLMADLPFREVPDLVIRREGMFDKIKGAFGFDDIDFESAEFSRRFYVSSPDKRFAYSVISPQMMEFMLANESPGILIRSGRCCLSDGDNTWTPTDFQAQLAWLRQFFDLWPAHVTTQLQQQSS
jgi:hypothetical protein